MLRTILRNIQHALMFSSILLVILALQRLQHYEFPLSSTSSSLNTINPFYSSDHHPIFPSHEQQQIKTFRLQTKNNDFQIGLFRFILPNLGAQQKTMVLGPPPLHSSSFQGGTTSSSLGASYSPQTALADSASSAAALLRQRKQQKRQSSSSLQRNNATMERREGTKKTRLEFVLELSLHHQQVHLKMLNYTWHQAAAVLMYSWNQTFQNYLLQRYHDHYRYNNRRRKRISMSRLPARFHIILHDHACSHGAAGIPCDSSTSNTTRGMLGQQEQEASVSKLQEFGYHVVLASQVMQQRHETTNNHDMTTTAPLWQIYGSHLLLQQQQEEQGQHSRSVLSRRLRRRRQQLRLNGDDYSQLVIVHLPLLTVASLDMQRSSSSSRDEPEDFSNQQQEQQHQNNNHEDDSQSQDDSIPRHVTATRPDPNNSTTAVMTTRRPNTTGIEVIKETSIFVMWKSSPNPSCNNNSSPSLHTRLCPSPCNIESLSLIEDDGNYNNTMGNHECQDKSQTWVQSSIAPDNGEDGGIVLSTLACREREFQPCDRSKYENGNTIEQVQSMRNNDENECYRFRYSWLNHLQDVSQQYSLDLGDAAKEQKQSWMDNYSGPCNQTMNHNATSLER